MHLLTPKKKNMSRNGLGWIGKFHRWFDWTAGCVAVTNDEVDELYQHVEIGTRIVILP